MEAAEGDQKIPVFTVFKKGVIIKNIFFNNPPPTLKSEEDDGDDGCEFLMGRHPVCQIIVDHPSISRFHLKVRRQRSSVFVTDLLSVHGSFVSGKKIKPRVPMELLEGDLLKLGASTRIYVLRWIGLNDQLEKPLMVLQEEIEEEHTDMVPPLEVAHNECLCSDEVVPELEEASEEMCSSPVSNFGGFTEIIPSPPVDEQLNSPEMKKPVDEQLNSPEMKKPVDEQLNSPEMKKPVNEQLNSPEMKKTVDEQLNSPEMKKPVDEQLNSPAMKKPVVLSGILSRRTKSNRRLPILIQKAQEEEPVSKVLFPGSVGEPEEDEVFDSDKENMTPQRSSSCYKSKKTQKGSLQMSPLHMVSILRESELGVASDEESMIQLQQPEYQSSNTPKAGERSLCKVLCFGNNEEEKGEEKEPYSSDKENVTPEISGDDHRKGKEMLSEKNRQIIENVTTKRKGLEKDRAPFQCLLDFSIGTSTNTTTTMMSPLSDSRRSNTENTNIAKRRVESSVVLFESLFKSTRSESFDVSSNQNEISTSTDNYGASSAAFTNANSREGRRKWNMVADISCFLNKDSRRSLQLLEGIRGTHLIIPRTVIRELECLKRGESLFRKGANNASSILRWIDKCMVQTDWWIHVQSSEEMMAKLQTPTPPSTPTISVGGESGGCRYLFNKSFMTKMDSAEVVSPKADDHILDCAIRFKKEEEQLVLLTQSISLKIRAMAKGILCETAMEFRESLVSPYSERFMWEESSPRGPTWSCSEDIQLIQCHYHHCPTLKKSVRAAEGAKGLKLILLHNAKYGGEVLRGNA